MGRKRIYSDAERVQRASASRERYRVANYKKVKERQKTWQERTGWKRKPRPGAHNSHKDQQRYNLRKYGPNALKAWTEQLFNQAGLCHICGGQGEQNKRPGLVMDHNHTTGKLRSLICSHCNVGLGMFKENPILLRAAIAYLKEHE